MCPKSFFSKQIGWTDGASLRLHVLFYTMVSALLVRTPKSGAKLTSLVWLSEKEVYIPHDFLYRLHILFFYSHASDRTRGELFRSRTPTTPKHDVPDINVSRLDFL